MGGGQEPRLQGAHALAQRLLEVERPQNAVLGRAEGKVDEGGRDFPGALIGERRAVGALRPRRGRVAAEGAALDDAQLNAVVAYVKYLDRPRDRGGDPLWHLGPMAEGAVAVVLGLGVLVLVTMWIGEREPTP